MLTAQERTFLASARRAALATLAPDGRARLVPICFVLRDAGGGDGPPLLYSPLDEKPKRVGDPRALARVRDLLADPRLTLLVDRWNEDWTELAWLRVDATGELLEPGPSADGEHEGAVALLREKYPQYAYHALETRPLLRIAIGAVRSWGRLDEPSSPRDSVT